MAWVYIILAIIIAGALLATKPGRAFLKLAIYLAVIGGLVFFAVWAVAGDKFFETGNSRLMISMVLTVGGLVGVIAALEYAKKSFSKSYRAKKESDKDSRKKEGANARSKSGGAKIPELIDPEALKAEEITEFFKGRVEAGRLETKNSVLHFEGIENPKAASEIGYEMPAAKKYKNQSGSKAAEVRHWEIAEYPAKPEETTNIEKKGNKEELLNLEFKKPPAKDGNLPDNHKEAQKKEVIGLSKIRGGAATAVEEPVIKKKLSYRPDNIGGDSGPKALENKLGKWGGVEFSESGKTADYSQIIFEDDKALVSVGVKLFDWEKIKRHYRSREDVYKTYGVYALWATVGLMFLMLIGMFISLLF